MSPTDRRRSIRLRLTFAVGALGTITAALALGGLYWGFDALIDREVDAGAGTGLGLSFVNAVAQLHAAELRIEDADPGLRVTLCFRPAEGT